MKKLFLIFLLLSAYFADGQRILMYVGDGASGYSGDNGQASTAEISFPIGISVDNIGNLLICENSFVRKVSFATNIITTLAGSDTASSFGFGGDGGLATCAGVFGPYAVCSDRTNNTYIADQWYSEIRKVTFTTGLIDTFAGCRLVGDFGDGANAKYAKFNTISCICIDTLNAFLYVSDGYNYRVRKINMVSGIIEAYAGNGTNGYSGDGGPATAANFSKVFGLVVDKVGNLYIGDWNNGRIRKVDYATGIVTTVVGNGTVGYSGDGGPATAAQINKTTAICFDSCGNMFFSDENNQRVRRVDATTGIITTVAGNGTAGYSGDGGTATAAEFNHPTGVAIDKYGMLYVADYYNHRVRRITHVTCNYKATDVEEVVLGSTSIALYPNPAEDIVTLKSGLPIQSVTVTNLVGQVVYDSHPPANTTQAAIAVKNLQAGVYFVRVVGADGGVAVQRFVKE